MQTDGIVWIAEGPLAADFDHDGRVGFADFILFVTRFDTQAGEPEFRQQFDLTRDGVVNLSDFLSFTEAFGSSRESQPSRPDYEVYVVDFGGDFVGVLDFKTHLFQDYLAFRSPSGMQISRDRASIYVAEAFGLFVLNAERELLYSVPLEAAGRVLLSPDEKFVYVRRGVYFSSDDYRYGAACARRYDRGRRRAPAIGPDARRQKALRDECAQLRRLGAGSGPPGRSDENRCRHPAGGHAYHAPTVGEPTC